MTDADDQPRDPGPGAREGSAEGPDEQQAGSVGDETAAHVDGPSDLPEAGDAHEAGDAPGQGDAGADELAGAIEAAEATLSRKPEVDYLLVADRAEVVNGKLYLMGGSWDRIQPATFPHRMMLGIALGVRIPFAHTDDQHTVSVELQHEGKRLVGFEARLTTGRPPGMAGMDMLVPMAFNIPVAIPEAGQLVLRAGVDGRAPRRHEIKAMQRPQRSA